jgi:hypothetical protein
MVGRITGQRWTRPAASGRRVTERASHPQLVEVEPADRVMNRHADSFTSWKGKVNNSYRNNLI